MLPGSTPELSFGYIADLVSEATLREGRTLEFKSQAVGKTDEEKREFLADVSSLANTAGGDIIYGIAEQGGLAVGCAGLELADPDAELLRLENILRSGLEPRLPTASLSWLPATSGAGLLLARVQRSWAAPHRVIANNRFYRRNSSGKYPLDVQELRSAFVAAEGAVAGLRSFRQERVLAVEGNDAPALLRAEVPRAILHILPLSTYLSGDTLSFGDNPPWLEPMGAFSSHKVFTLDGLLTAANYGDSSDDAGSYALLFRNGAVEAVVAAGDRSQNDGEVWGSHTESRLIKGYSSYASRLRSLGLVEPFVIFLSMVNVQGCKVAQDGYFSRPLPRQRKNVLLLPELVISDDTGPAPQVLRPLLDLFWNAFGFASSPNFDVDGNHQPSVNITRELP